MQNEVYGLALSPPEVNDDPRDVFREAPIRIFHSFVLSHIYAGEGRLRLENTKQEMRLPTGSVVILRPKTPNVYGGIPQSDYREDFIFFHGDVVDRMVGCGMLETGVYPFGITRKLPEIALLLRDPAPESQFRARLLFQQFLVELHLVRNRAPRRRKLNQLMAEISARPEHWWTVNDMADFCGYSTDQFRKNFLDATGMNPKHYIERSKIQRAAELLCCSAFSIAEICRKFGYRDRFHFSRRFRVLTGMSPGEYRQRFNRRSL